MKDNNLRKMLGIHDPENYLCGCDWGPKHDWLGELPMLWRKVSELEGKIKELEALCSLAYKTSIRAEKENQKEKIKCVTLKNNSKLT